MLRSRQALPFPRMYCALFVLCLIDFFFFKLFAWEARHERRARRPLRMLGSQGSLGPLPMKRPMREFPLFPPYILAGNNSFAPGLRVTLVRRSSAKDGKRSRGGSEGKGGEGRAANHPRENLINLPFGERCKSEKEVFDDDAVILWRCFRTALPDDVVRLRCAPAAAVAEHTDAHANYYETF
ncbi:hypothetical protein J3E68DRAFT_396206 [Trichoderma sp. SZMC 28012]